MITVFNKVFSLVHTTLFCVVLLFVSQHTLFAQDRPEGNPLLNLTLEELMDVKIISATKTEESTFLSPVTSYVISSEDILSSGATSIPEALRLCPGMIVRQTSNGSYDVSIRGGADGFTAYNTNFINTTILTMIDNQPVFNYLDGGTFWQNLPVGLADIERIEIVFGPTSALYGPNAVSGVIHIITKNHGLIEKTNTSAVIYQGIHSQIVSLRSAYRFNSKFQVAASLHHEDYKRFDEDMYSITLQKHTPFDSVPSQLFQNNRQINYPYENQSLYRQSAIVALHYSPRENISIHLKGASNNNMGMFPLITSVALSNFSNNSKNIDLSAKIKQLSIQASYINGKQGISGNNPAYFYLYENLHSYMDYTISILSEKVKIRPAIGFQSAYANDKMFSVDYNRFGVFNNEGRINNMSASLMTDIVPTKKIRLNGSLRYDRFNYPDRGVLSYLLASTYQLTNTHNLRFITSRSYNSSFLQPTFLNFRLSTPLGNFVSLGNENVDLLQNTLIEIGYRSKLKKQVHLDISVFRQEFSNFCRLVRDSIILDPNTMINTTYNNFNNSNNIVIQNGITLSLDYLMPNGFIRFRPNITIQNTEIVNDVNNIDDSRNFYSIATPKVFSGCHLTVRPIKKVSVDVSAYYLDGSIFFVTGYQTLPKFSTNINLTYKASEKVNVYVNCRNLSDHSGMEGVGTDIIKSTMLFGLNINY